MEMKEIYPKLPNAPPIDDQGQGYRLQKINEIQFLRTKSVTKKEMNKCMAKIYDPGGIRTRAARLISQYHNH